MNLVHTTCSCAHVTVKETKLPGTIKYSTHRIPAVCCVCIPAGTNNLNTSGIHVHTVYTYISKMYPTGYRYRVHVHVYDVHVFTIRCKVLQFSHLSLGAHICKHLLKRQLLLVFLFLNLHQMLIDILNEPSKR